MGCLLKGERGNTEGLRKGLTPFVGQERPDKKFPSGGLLTSQEMAGQFLRHPLEGLTRIPAGLGGLSSLVYFVDARYLERYTNITVLNYHYFDF